MIALLELVHELPNLLAYIRPRNVQVIEDHLPEALYICSSVDDIGS